MIRLADYVAQEVSKQGVDKFFMLSGGMMMHLMDAFARIPGMTYVCNHHEQASAMGADGFSRESGKLGVCLATSGPGATNILTGLVGAFQDSVPILFLTGQCKVKETIQGRGIKGLRQCGFLETDIVPIVESVTKYAAFIKNPEDIRMHLEKALYLAQSGRPGPVLLDVPLDVQGALIDPAKLRSFKKPTARHHFKQKDLKELVSRIRNAKRPLILAGHGIRCAGMVNEFEKLVTKLNIPVVTSLMAKDLIAYDHPLFAGHPGPRANRGANFVIQSADLIISMGCSLHIQTVGYEGELFAPDAFKIQLDMDKPLLQRQHVGVHWQLDWDIKEYVPKLARADFGKDSINVNSEWIKTATHWKELYSSRNESHDFGTEKSRVNLYEFLQVLGEESRGTESFLVDAGQPHPIFGQAFEIKKGQRYINPGSLAEMGYALPAAIGVAAASPEKNIVAIIGDGSLQTNIHELQTVKHLQPNIKIFVINNDGYASIKNTQNGFFNGFFVGSTPESGVSLPNTEKITKAYGIRYISCSNRSQLRSKIKAVLKSPGPVLCEVLALANQKISPVVPSKMLPDGSIKSMALHEMVPEIGDTLEALQQAAGIFNKQS
jgi:acetolactate synthase-1/2/3 large subunit